MTTDSLSDYLRYNKSKNYKFLNEIGEGSDWGWMGLCHGWAPAAIMAKTPKSHVVVSLDDKKLILTQGDLRGLLTYSWANYAPRSEFWGTRCNIDVENPASVGPVDTHGRGYTGKIILSDGQEKNFFQIREVRGLVDQRYADAVYNQAMIVKFDDANKTIGVLYQVVRSSTPRNRQQPWELYADTKSLLQTLRKAGSNGTSVKLEIFGCWDTNPATFHTALVEKLGKEKLGFVMDRTQAGQVWNQPVHKAKTVVGKAISIGELSLERLRHITPGTAFVAEVVSEVEWLAEPSDPEMSYTPEFEEDYNHTSKFKYILEFDRRGKMIGGEWGNLESVQPESESGKQQIPDFLFAYKQGQKPHDNLTNGFDYTQIIDKIHACSLDEPTTTIDVAGKAEPAVECTIQKVRPTP